jgi:mycothiol synthase
VPLPEGVRLRAFVPGQDEDAWLAVNADAFAEHAEQGRWTRLDLEMREGEAWFDPSGFLLAFLDETLVGFHWTKVQTTGVGEVYILGVAPEAQGLHLGPALLSAGLAYLAGRGVAEVMLYVDESNSAAMRMYRRYGFAEYDMDAQYARP